MRIFFRFPSTPHLAWLGKGQARNDKVLSPQTAAALLMGEVVVEEKLDGANVGFSLAEDGTLLAQNRGQYLAEPHVGQFARLPAWISVHVDRLLQFLDPSLMIFGEWCAARHSLEYLSLPDWFLLFDVYDRVQSRFWSTERRNVFAKKAGLFTVPQIQRSRTSLLELERLVSTATSRYGPGPIEGIVIRRESSEWCESRAKLLRPDFAQSIDLHWRKRGIQWNRVDAPITS